MLVRRKYAFYPNFKLQIPSNFKNPASNFLIHALDSRANNMNPDIELLSEGYNKKAIKILVQFYQSYLWALLLSLKSSSSIIVSFIE